MKIGIFGGTFNPIHNGHLLNAQFVKESFYLDRILFIPSRYPVHKNLDGEISAEHRVEMARLSIYDNIFFELSRIEIDRIEKSYTVLTVKELMKIYPAAEFYLIVGSDTFKEIDSWKNIEELTELVSFIIMNRPGSGKPSKKILRVVKNFRFAENPLLEISSSKIRENIRKGRSIKYMVPHQVEEYILNKGLYRN